MDDEVLAPAPQDERGRELWIQHAAGHVIFRDIRQYAIGRLRPDLAPEVRQVATEAIDSALYGPMMVFDGVTGSLGDADRNIVVGGYVRYTDQGHSTTLDFFNGDGMCMGYSGWLAGDWGDNPVLATPHEATPEGTG